MKIFLIVLCTIITLIILIMLMKMSVYIRIFGKDTEKFSAKVRVYFYFKWLGFDINLSDDEKSKNKTDKEPQKQKSDKTIVEEIQNFHQIFLSSKYTYLLSREAVRKRVFVKKLDFALDFGLSDAAQTGISTGVLWGIIYNIFALITKITTVEQHSFTINPIFDKSMYNLCFEGIIKSRIGSLVIIAFLVMSNYQKSCEIINNPKNN